ncbi:MAG: Zn-dependent hydrolase [Alphaproteobacteria bacterium]
MTRPAWSPEDRVAGELVAAEAARLGLEARSDAAGNMFFTLPGRDRSAPAVLTGSHLDSVPKGGNYDGLAGIVAGLTALAACKDAGFEPACDVTVMAMTGEESVWYGIAYVGSRLATGVLPPDQWDSLKRDDTGRSLAEHMAAVGVDLAALRAAAPSVTPADTRAFLELHIEQGPILIGEKVAVAVPTTIRGNVRFPYARCFGSYDHSGATPRAYRSDAALAVADLIGRLEAFWIEREAAGVPDTVFTVGKLFTDASEHTMTKVPGRVDFTLNFGGTTQAFLDESRDLTIRLAQEIAAARRVRFELGECVGSSPTPLDGGLRRLLVQTATDLGQPVREFATVGHDASIFARAGIPSAMLLVRNTGGSHNPYETMEMADFGEGARLLAAAIAKLAA